MHHVSEVTVPCGSGAAATPDKHVLVKPSDNRIRRNADRYVSMVVIGIVDVSPFPGNSSKPGRDQRFVTRRDDCLPPIPAHRGRSMQCLEISGSQFAEAANGAPTARHSPKTFTNASGRGSQFESPLLHHPAN